MADRRVRRVNRSWLESLRGLFSEADFGRNRVSRRGRSQGSLARRNQQISESLEPRLMLTLDVSLNNGNLLVQETSAGADNLEVGIDPATSEYIFRDAGQALTTSISQATGDGTKEIRVPAAIVTGGIRILTGASDDSVTVSNTFGSVSGLSVSLDLEAGNDTVQWNAAALLNELTVVAETTALDVEVLETVGKQDWQTALKLSGATSLIGAGISLADVELGQKDFNVSSTADIEVRGDILNGGSGDVNLDAHDGILISDGQVETNAGNIFLLATSGGLQIVNSAVVSGSGNIFLEGISFSSDGLAILNSSVATSANGEVTLRGAGGPDRHGILIEGTTTTSASIATQNRNIDLQGFAGSGDGHGILLRYGKLSTNNGSMALAGLSDRASAAGTLLEHSDILVTGNGNVALIAGSREEQFGSGSNRFSLEFGQIGDIYNAADTTGAPNPAGSVGYEYQMGRYEISRDMIEKANAAAGLGITLEDMSDRGGNGVNRPATGISWYEAAQFVNWLNTSKGYSPAYKFVDGTFQLWTSSDEGYDSLNPYRNLNAKYVIPSMDEWYKAAFFDPVTEQYFDFATGSNSTPTSVTGGTEPGTAVYGHAQSQGPADITNAGGLSPYGMMAMSGNAFEWIETAYDTNNSAAGEDRFLRGGAFSTARDPVASLKASDSFPYAPTNEGYNSGFRVVSLHQDVNGLVRLDDSSISVKSGVVQVEGGLEALGSTITTTTGGIGVSGASASIRTLDSALTSDSGNIVLTGNGTRDDVSGIELADTAVSTGGTGIVTLTGRGGMTASGVLLKKIGANGTQIQTGDGAITIEGFGGDTAGNGIQVDGASVATSAAGSIVLRGAGSTGNSGILLQGDGSQTSQISTKNGSLTLQGWAGDGGDAVVATKYRVTTTGEGSIDVLGSVNGAGTYAFSATDSTIAATGSGNIDIRAESRQYQFGDTSAYGPGNPAALEIDFTTIGAPGNDDDTTGKPNPAGKVDYVYQIGTYEISRGQIEAYNAAWGTANGLAISLNDMTNYGGNGVNKPATGVSWNEAARFVNWLNTSQGYQPAYKFTTNGVNDNIDLWTSEDAGYDSTNPYRNSLAKYVLPSMDEWYKAAYYDPATSTYRDYASADGTLPTAVKSGTDPNTAVYNQSSSTGPADHNQAGGLNAFGVMGMSGNLWEWEETSLDLSNSSPGLRRALNGGSFSVDADGISSSSRGNHDSTHEAATTFGFRVATLLTHNPTKILLNHTTLRINTGALTVDAEKIVLQGQESVVITSGSDQLIASDFSGTGHLRKLGAAQLTLSGDYATLGVIYVRSGILNIAGTASGNIVTESDANGFGTLVGTGTITGDVTAAGNSVIAPGGSAGILSTGNLDLQSGANLQLELGGSTAGNSASSHDQVVVTGQVQLAGDLELSLINNFTPGIGDVLLLISNDGTDAISGTFAGLVEGDQFAAQGISWKISYVGGTGNDVTITRLGAVFDVTNLEPTGSGSLFQAITDANATAGEDLIRILTTGVLAVTSSGVLPSITEPVRIDGTTAPDYAGVPLFEVRGTDAGNVSGLVFTSTADDSELVALSITDFAQHGVVLSDAVTLTRNWIGVDLTGAARGNDGAGVRVLAAGAVVGDGGVGSGNVISGNLVGVEISGAAATGVKVQGNLIGLNPAGTAAIANATGIRIDKGAFSNLIGTDGDGADDDSERNIISGNSGVGILLSHNDRDGNAPSGGDVTHLNTIAGNYIGTTPDGAAKLSNGQYGIHISALVKQTLVGTDANGTGDAAEGNLISGNTLQGIVINGNENTVAGNLIGTNATQTERLNNGGTGGIFINGADNVIGGSSAAARNIISGNNAGSASGVRIEGGTAKRNKLQGNYIGLTSDGTALANTYSIAILNGAADTQVGGTGSGEGNVLSGNTDKQIWLVASTGTLIQGNYIGTNPDGTAARGNNHGIYLTGDVTGTVIGGSAAGAGNLISGNQAAGIYVYKATGGLQIQGNLIGTKAGGGEALANDTGIVVIADGVKIGGDAAGEGNVISGNTNDGIRFVADASLQNTGNVVQGNLIGLKADGTAGLGNGIAGVHIFTANVQVGGSSSLTGGVLSGAGNVIGGNNVGVEISGAAATGNVIQGNHIGTNAAGTEAIANTYGVRIDRGAEQNIVGTDGNGATDDREGNLISGNTAAGILLAHTDRDGNAPADGVFTKNNRISGNLIGTNVDGSAALANEAEGILIQLNVTGNLIGSDGNGTGDAAEPNLVSGNKGTGIAIYGHGNQVRGNVVGLNLAQSASLANNGEGGIALYGDANFVGGSSAAERNIIAGNNNVSDSGIYVSGGDSNIISGNYVGLNSSGDAIPNSRGIGLWNAADGTLIGGTVTGAGNVISGHSEGEGIYIGDSAGTLVQGNLIGTNPDGTAARANHHGIYLTGAVAGTIIGGGNGAENVISGSKYIGVYAEQATGGIAIRGNLIGTNASGDAAIGNEDGIVVIADDVVIGGTTAGDQNVISGNTRYGVDFRSHASLQQSGNVVQGNFIGTSADGLVDLGNANSGIRIATDNVQIGGVNTSSAGVAGAGNLISGNDTYGIEILSTADSTVVQGNLIGVDATGGVALANTYSGVYTSGTNGLIGTDADGTTDAGEANVISGNTLHGIHADGASGLTIAGNTIGLKQTGAAAAFNQLTGIRLEDSGLVQVGGGDGISGNVIGSKTNAIEVIDAAGPAHIAGNILGLTSDEQTALLGATGIYVLRSEDLVIGTDGDGTNDAAEGNVIAGMTGHGILLARESNDSALSATDSIVIAGNSIGIRSDGSGADDVRSGGHGILNYVNGVRIGTDGDGVSDAAEQNIIASAVNYAGVTLTGTAATGNVIAGNRIGLNAANASTLVNYGNAIRVNSGASGNRIGTDGSDDANNVSERNLLMGGIHLVNGDNNTIAGNYFSTADGVNRIDSSSFVMAMVWLEAGSSGNIIGTDGDGTKDDLEANIITTPSGRSLIEITGDGSDNNVVAGNRLNINVDGSSFGLVERGIYIYGGASGNQIGTDGDGTSDSLERNVVGGTKLGMIFSGSGTDNNVIAGNYIGVGPDGETGVGNTQAIIIQGGAAGTRIGTDGSDDAFNAMEGNLISANGFGIQLTSTIDSNYLPSGGVRTSGTIIAGNRIGLTASGQKLSTNNGYAIEIRDGVTGTRIGTNSDGVADASERNVISGSTNGAGIQIYDWRTMHLTMANEFIAGNQGTLAASGTVAQADLFQSNSDSSTTAGYWQYDHPLPGGWASINAYRATGKITVSTESVYTFVLTGADGGQLKIGGNLVLQDGYGQQNDTRGTITLAAGSHTFEWLGYSARAVSGAELSVAVGDVSTAVSEANGWRVLGAANAHSEIALDGVINVDVYHPDVAELATVIAGNRIGTSIDGQTAIPNATGVAIYADGVTVGGSTAAARNIIAGNTNYGVLIGDTGILSNSGNSLSGNYIGVAADGTSALPNGTSTNASGVIIGADNVLVGGVGGFSGLTGSGNLISGSKSYGIELRATASGNVIQGNYIGTTSTGNAALANVAEGIAVFGDSNQIGGSGSGTGNLISGSTLSGVRISGGIGNSLLGNRIGTNAAGTAALPNGKYGVLVDSGASDTRIGSGVSGARNVISGHTLSGVMFDAAGTGNLVQGNYIGTAASGAAALPNATDTNENSAGVMISDAGESEVIVGTNGDGTRDTSEGNLISGNRQSGVLIVGGSAAAGGHTVAGNSIGVNAGLNAALPNRGHGVTIVNSNGNLIGSNGDGVSDAAEANQIAGNRNPSAGNESEYSSGVLVIDNTSDDSNLTEGNIIAGNAIGTDRLGEKPLPNQGNGITVISAKGTQIGGSGVPNLLRFNALAGVRITGTTDEGERSDLRTSLLANSFQANDGLPVDLGDSGQNLNSNTDGVLDFPVFTSAAITDGVMTLEGFAESGWTFDLYLNAGQVGQEFGDGVVWLARFTEGSNDDQDDTTGAYGPEVRGVTVATGTLTRNKFSFQFPLPDGVNNGVQMTGIASSGGVSEFSSLILAGEQGSAVEPEITLENSSDPVLINELVTMSVDGSFYDPDSTSWTATVDYGDGDGAIPLALSAARTFTLQHIYDTPGSYTVTVQIVDAGLAAGTAEFDVTVANVVPDVDFSSFDFTTSASEGGTVSLSGSFVDGANAHVVEITWGDSETSTINLDPGTLSFEASHAYADDTNSAGATTASDIYAVEVTIRDAAEGTGTDSPEGMFLTEISNVRPTLDSLLFNGSELAANEELQLNEGATLALTGGFTDPGTSDVHTVRIDWGDGTIAEFDLTVGDRSFSGEGAFSHVYANDDEDAYTVVVEMWDDDEPALRTKLTRSVQVVDVAASSVVVDVLPATVAEGQSVQVSGTFVDPGSEDAHQVRVIWGDGSPDSILNVAGGVLTYGGSALSHTYLNNRVGEANYPITVEVSDLADVTAAGSGSTTVGVTNVAPVAGSLTVKRMDGTTGAIAEGERVVVTGSFTDVSAVDRHRVTISWGDGRTSNAAVDAMNRTFTATHRYLDNFAAAEITATVTDGRYVSGTFVADGGVSTSDAVTQEVTNVAPTPTIAPVAGSTPTVTKLIAEVVDPGLDDIPDLTYEWQIGDGLGFTTVSTSRILEFNSTLYSQPLIRLYVSDDDGGDGQDDVVAVFGTDDAETITITDTGATISSGGGGLGGIPGGSINWANRILVLGFGGSDTLDATDLSASYTAILDGGQLKDFLFGGAGEDVFYPNDGNDYVSGGSGDDSYFLTPNSTLTVLDVSGDNVLDFSRTEFGDATGIVFDLTAVRNTGNLADFDEAVDTQLVSTANGTQHQVAAFGNFTTLLGSNYGDTLTIGSNDSVDGGAGADTISLTSNTSNAVVNGGADDDILLVSGTNITDLTFSGDDGLDLLQNVGEITGLTFGGGADDDILENSGSILGTLNFGGDDGIDILTNTGTIGDLIFNGGADDDIFINNGSVATTLDFGGDDDLFLSGAGSIGSLTFSGDDGADIFANLGSITSLTFTGGADDDIFINVGTSTSLNFGGDDDVLLSNDGSVGTIGTLVFNGDDGIDEFRNFGEITTLTFNGGADDDVFTNYAGGTLTSLTFGGDDGLDLLQNAGTISGLTFNGGADDDTLLNTADGVLSSLVFGGDAGSDILTNFGTIDGLTFSGGADDDVLTNVGTISSTLVFGGDDGIDSFLNTGVVDQLTFGGGADDDILTNYDGGSIATLGFGGDDGIDTISNYGEITSLDFGGGADADILLNGVGGEIGRLFFGGDYESDGNGGFTPIGSIADNGADILGNYGSITTLLFRGGADDDVLVNYSGGSLGTLNFGGDDGLDILQNDGTVTTLTFGGGADDDTLINNGTVTGTLVFGGDQQFSATDELEQIANAADDGVDILANYGTLGGVDFSGGADDDILLNDTTGTIGTLVFGGDAGADILQNLGSVTSLTFNGGADDDLLLNSGSGLSELIFSGDDGADILFNEGGTITDLTFSGGADDDLLLNTASSITNLTFNGGADDDVLQNTGDSVVTLDFTGDAGLDVLLNTGSDITTLSFGGGADDDILSSSGDNIGVLIFGGDLDPDTGEPIAGTNFGNDTLIVSGSGTGAADSRILFSGDDGADAFQNDATGFTSIIFNGGADDDVFQNNASSIGGLVFNGGADDDVLENNGSSLTSLVFGGDDGADILYNTGDSVSGIDFTGGADDDILLNTGASVSGIIFSGDAGADIFSNTGAELSSLTFSGGADDDIFVNTGAGISEITFSGDDGADLFWNKSTGLDASTLIFSGDDGADILVNEAGGVTDLTFNGGADDDAFQNSGVSLSGLIFNGGADDDTLLNTSTGSILTLSFGGDDGNDILQTVGAVTTLNFGGGADDDILSTQGTVETLVFMGDGELDNDGNLVQISAAGDDGVDTLLNEATVTTLTFTGGADDDIFVNNNTVTTLTFSGGADDDTFQNNAYVTSLTFSGGADDDILINNASGMPSLVFSGDDGFDSFVNNGNDITSLTFEGGADEDILRVHGTGIGDITFTGGADAAADTFHFNGTAAAGSTIVFTGGDGDDVFAWRGTADGATFTAGGGNDTSIIQGSGSLTIDGGPGDDSWIFEADPDASVSITETWSGADDSSSDTLDFSSFTGGALTIDLRSTTAQVLSDNLTITLSDARGMENVTGTPEADTIYGNLQDNIILGAEYSDGYGGDVAADRGVTQWVLLDFDTYSEDGEHVYTTDERDQITDRVETLYRGADTNSPVFDVRVVQTRGEIPVADGQFVTIYFNDTPAFGRPGGLASEIDPGNLSQGGTAVVQVNGLLGGTITADDTTGDGGGDEGSDKGFSVREIRDDPVGVAKPDATSENFVLLSAKIAAHELAHLMGLRHQDSFGPIGLGIHDPPGIDGYNPVYPGPVAAVETFDHLLGSGASVGTDRFNDLRDLFFSERSAMKLAFATADTDDVFTIESSSAHSTSATAQTLPLTTVDVPNTLSSGLNSTKVFYVQMQSVEGTIELDAGTGKSENDWYSFTGTAGDVMNIELFSNSLTRYGTANDNYIDSILRVWYEVDGDLILVPWFGSDAVNDDIFEPTDSALVDLILPSDGVYYIEIDTFKRDPSDPLFDETDPSSPLNPANPNNYLSYPDLLDRFLSTRDDTDVGNYQLIVSRFDRGSASDGIDTIKGYGGTDTIDAGDGDDYSLTVTAGGAGTSAEGGSFSRDISLVDRGAVSWSGSTVNYGDGTGDIDVSVADNGTATLGHTFADSGVYTVSVTIRDDIGQEVTETFDVTVSNVAPTVDTLTGEQEPDEGTTETYSFTASDAGDDTFAVVEISGGNLGTVSNISLNSATGSGTFDVTFGEVTTGATASTTLSVKLKDSDDAESNVLTLAVTVQNVGTGPEDITLSSSSIEENAASGTEIGTLSTTDPSGQTSFTYSLVSGDGDTDNASFSISGDKLLSAAVFDYEESATRSVRIRTADSSGNTYDEAFTISITNIADEAAPVSDLADLPLYATSTSLTIEASGTDSGDPASGIASFALYYSTGSGFTQFATVTPASPSTVFVANANTTYWFRSLATDVAGNTETKNTNDAYTIVGDIGGPASEVTSATAADTGLISLVISGAKSGGRALTTFDVYMSVDSGAAEKVASVNSVEVSTGVYSGAAVIQGIVDGASHEYAFYTRAIDGSGNIEDAPGTADKTVTATFSGSSLTAQSIDVQRGANQRSYIRYLDVLFSDDPTDMLDPGRVAVERFALDATSVDVGTGTAISGFSTTRSGNSVQLDFGATGLGGLNQLGDGFYRVLLDLDGDGSLTGAGDSAFEFYRVFGDANGDREVSAADLTLIRSQLNRSGDNLDADIDGSGRVTGADFLLGRRRVGQKLRDWLFGWLDD